MIKSLFERFTRCWSFCFLFFPLWMFDFNFNYSISSKSDWVFIIATLDCLYLKKNTIFFIWMFNGQTVICSTLWCFDLINMPFIFSSHSRHNPELESKESHVASCQAALCIKSYFWCSMGHNFTSHLCFQLERTIWFWTNHKELVWQWEKLPFRVHFGCLHLFISKYSLWIVISVPIHSPVSWEV